MCKHHWRRTQNAKDVLVTWAQYSAHHKCHMPWGRYFDDTRQADGFAARLRQNPNVDDIKTTLVYRRVG